MRLASTAPTGSTESFGPIIRLQFYRRLRGPCASLNRFPDPAENRTCRFGFDSGLSDRPAMRSHHFPRDSRMERYPTSNFSISVQSPFHADRGHGVEGSHSIRIWAHRSPWIFVDPTGGLIAPTPSATCRSLSLLRPRRQYPDSRGSAALFPAVRHAGHTRP